MKKAIQSKFPIILVVFSISLIQGLQQCVSPVLDQIRDQYPQIDVSYVQMLVTAPLIAAIFSSLLSGVMVAHVSKKKLLVLAAAVAGTVGLLPLLSDSFALLFLSRVMFGFSMGLCMALNAAVVADFFEGDERPLGMGIQSACVGLGMLIVTTLAGNLGAGAFKRVFWVNLLAFAALAIIARFLPDRGPEKRAAGGGGGINAAVIGLAVFGFLQSMFSPTFATNISFHLSGALAGDSKVSGMVMGVFSVSQIIVGLLLGKIAARLRCMTLPAAVLCFVPGALVLLAFPDRLPLLMLGALLCGFTQGMFMPQASTEATNAVDAASATMAAAVLSGGVCLGQLASPLVSNSLAELLLGEVTTAGVYGVAAGAMLLIGAALALWERKQGKSAK